MSARVLCLGLLFLACGPRDLEVLMLPPSPDGGMPLGPVCTVDSDCMGLGYCDKATCNAVAGRCKRRPIACRLMPDPVCGCDGVNYWNDCVRQEHQVTSSTAGECSAPITCSALSPCRIAGASCALLLSDSAASCATVPSGVCWMVPMMCPPDETSAWESCSGAPICGGLCAAIRSGVTHRKVNSCP